MAISYDESPNVRYIPEVASKPYDVLPRMSTIGYGEEPPVVRILDEIQRTAVESRASDIHIEPFNGSGRVRFRIDGVLHTTRALPAELYQRIVSRMKLLAEMDIADKRQPQDGRYAFTVHDRPIDARVASMPTIGG